MSAEQFTNCPRLECELAFVLPARPVLGEQAWPVVPVAVHHRDAGRANVANHGRRPNTSDRVAHGCDDPGVGAVTDTLSTYVRGFFETQPSPR
jgi:hypothetical protein